MKWIFARRLAGRSVASIGRMLNEQRVPCPSRVDRERNPHRSGQARTLRTVAAILANPRYTGRQVWNRQRTDRDPVEAVDGQRRYTEVHRWNQAQHWVISEKVVHPPLVGEENFVAAQAVRVVRAAEDGSVRMYLLAGLLRCGLCGRRMDAHWVNDRPGYRCRHGHTSAQQRVRGHPKNLYVREDRLLDGLADRYAGMACGSDRLHPVLPADGLNEVVAFLRENDLTIVCDRRTWVLKNDSASEAASAGVDDACLIPRQRSNGQPPTSHETRTAFMG
ncbi:recombinase family protein [Solwaraspora sp. WMMB335]|uniref:recombinase family protein n=1 Tax=Solwaraspora sp. WMMB335 TaxID=3404118 RepID=UPI003B94EF7C